MWGHFVPRSESDGDQASIRSQEPRDRRYRGRIALLSSLTLGLRCSPFLPSDSALWEYWETYRRPRFVVMVGRRIFPDATEIVNRLLPFGSRRRPLYALMLEVMRVLRACFRAILGAKPCGGRVKCPDWVPTGRGVYEALASGRDCNASRRHRHFVEADSLFRTVAALGPRPSRQDHSRNGCHAAFRLCQRCARAIAQYCVLPPSSMTCLRESLAGAA